MWKRSGRAAHAMAGAVAMAAALAFVPAAAIARPASGHAAAHTKKKKGAQSIGAPNHGHLAGAVRLRGSKTLRQREGAYSWGLPQLVHMLHRAASAVARKHRGSQMLVGDLSGRTGGHLDHHGSHQSGRDADVGFYVTSSKGKPMAVKRFIPFDDAGNARDALRRPLRRGAQLGDGRGHAQGRQGRPCTTCSSRTACARSSSPTRRRSTCART